MNTASVYLSSVNMLTIILIVKVKMKKKRMYVGLIRFVQFHEKEAKKEVKVYSKL